MTVDRIASTIAVSLTAVGCVVNLVSISADSDNPWGAAPVRSVNTPTTAGRRFGSGNPERCGLPSGLVSPTNSA